MGAESADGDYLGRNLRALFDDVASGESVPAAGSVIAVLGALAAGLAAKVAHRSATRLPEAQKLADRADALRATFEPIITADALGYAAALSVRGADRAAAMMPLSTELLTMVETATEVAELAATLAATGNPNLSFDADAAARIAVTVAEIGAQLITANLGDSELTSRALSATERARTAGRNSSASLG